MRIGLITDLHTSRLSEYPFGIDLRENLKSVTNAVIKEDIDLLWLGGDFCLKEGVKSTYQWQKELLDALRIPYRFVVGNHDDTHMMGEVYGNAIHLEDGELYYRENHDEVTILYLDTSKGWSSDLQKTWLRRQCRSIATKQLFVLMHHPPALMDVPFMDKGHALTDREEMLTILQSVSCPVHVFVGHYHVHRTRRFNNVTVHITPSCYLQIDTTTPHFQIDHRKIAYRIIDVSECTMETQVYYLPGHKRPGDWSTA